MPYDEFLKNDAFLTRELLRVACASSGIAVWKVDPRQGSVELSSAMKAMLGLQIDQQIDYDAFFSLLHPDDREATRRILGKTLAPDGSGECELEFRTIDASQALKWFTIRGRAFFEGEGADRRSNLFIGTLRDITDAKNADAALRAAVDQQRELLHEVNHRVKNSLQLVSSLLRLQARRAPEIVTRRQLDDATARISTIAHIHERLYRDQDIKRIRFGAFVTELCADLQGSAAHCSLKVQTPEFLVETDRAIPLALIINELVTNAFKHAYPDGGGAVAVTVEQALEGKVVVSVADNGAGLPQGFSVEKAGSLGMILTASMIQQLSGRLEVRSGHPGTTFIITASIGNPKG